jgi:hypothetical protein
LERVVQLVKVARDNRNGPNAVTGGAPTIAAAASREESIETICNFLKSFI